MPSCVSTYIFIYCVKVVSAGSYLHPLLIVNAKIFFFNRRNFAFSFSKHFSEIERKNSEIIGGALPDNRKETEH